MPFGFAYGYGDTGHSKVSGGGGETDTTPPLFLNLTINADGTGTVYTNEDSDLVWVIMDSEQVFSDASDIQAASGVLSGTQALVSGDNAVSLDLSSLTPEVDYYFYAGAIDLAGNPSEVLSSVISTIPAYTAHGVIVTAGDILSRAAALTGVTDGRTMFGLISVDFEDLASVAYRCLWNGAGANIFRDTGGGIWINITDVDGTIRSIKYEYVTGAVKCNIVFSVNADGTSRMRVWLAASQTWASATLAAFSKDLRRTNGSITVFANGSVQKFKGTAYMVEMWFGLATAPDISDQAILDKLVNPTTGLPVNPALAETEWGAPTVKFDGTASEFPTNDGTGGAFSLLGDGLGDA